MAGSSKTILALALTGAIIGAGAWLLAPRKYVAMTAVRVPQRYVDLGEQILFPGSLLNNRVLLDPSLDLYPEYWERVPEDMDPAPAQNKQPESQGNYLSTGRPPAGDSGYLAGDAVIQKLHQDLQIQQVDWIGPALRISFAYPDKGKARAVVDKLASDLVRSIAETSGQQARMWQSMWPQEQPPALDRSAEIIVPSTILEKSIGPNLLVFVTAGLLSGLVIALVMGRPKQALFLAAFAASGAVVGLAAALFIPNTYTSTAVLRVEPPAFPERPESAVFVASMEDRFLRSQQRAFDYGACYSIISRLKLYDSDHTKIAMENLVWQMHTRDLAIRTWSSPAGDHKKLIRISFSYPDGGKARHVVESFVAELVNSWMVISDQMARHGALRPGEVKLWDRHLGGEVAVLDAASLRAARYVVCHRRACRCFVGPSRVR